MTLTPPRPATLKYQAAAAVAVAVAWIHGGGGASSPGAC